MATAERLLAAERARLQGYSIDEFEQNMRQAIKKEPQLMDDHQKVYNIIIAPAAGWASPTVGGQNRTVNAIGTASPITSLTETRTFEI